MNSKLKAWQYIYSVNSEADTDPERMALTDGVKSFSYNEMFEMWKRYASVFSALHMTGADRARVGLLGTTSPEVILSFYALNIVGAEISMLSALNAMHSEKIIRDVGEEHLTDLILTDEILSEKTIRELLGKKEKLGLRNIILLHTSLGGSTVPMPVMVSGEAKAAALRNNFPMMFMEMLLFYYGNAPIRYAEGEAEASFILHTSGTTGGSGKPVTLSDAAFNTVCGNLHSIGEYEEVRKDLISPVIVDLSNVFGMVVQVHAMLSLGATVVTIPGNAINPLMYRAVPAHRISLLFCLGAMADIWMKIKDPIGMDFSSIRMVILGGSYLSAEDKKRYYRFFSEHGAGNFVLLNGYGISEVGGVCTLTKPDPDDESIGYALPGYDLKFFDEDAGKFLTLKDAPCTGTLYIHSPAMTTGRLDGKQIIPLERINGRDYVCTNDLVRADRDGKLTYLGRANRYFLNRSGEKYQSGRVETEISRQAGVESCGIVPVYEKVGHDNLPMLCVKTTAECAQPLETVRQALWKVFREEKTLSASQMPEYVLLAEDLPRNANGKIDLYKINRGEVAGRKYAVEAVLTGDELRSLTLTPLKEEKDNMIEAVYKGLAQDLISDAVKKPEFGPGQAEEQMRAWQLQMQMYRTLMMQQNMLMMSWMNRKMTETVNRMGRFRSGSGNGPDGSDSGRS